MSDDPEWPTLDDFFEFMWRDRDKRLKATLTPEIVDYEELLHRLEDAVSLCLKGVSE